MDRNALISLDNWRKSVSRKPLILRGARQVGKTWLLKEFGRLRYEETVYINDVGHMYQSRKMLEAPCHHIIPTVIEAVLFRPASESLRYDAGQGGLFRNENSRSIHPFKCC